MERSPLFDKRALEAVDAKIKQGGGPEVAKFFEQEPYLQQLVQRVVTTTIAKAFEGRDLEDPAEAEFFKTVAKNMHFACTKILLVTRGCYRDLSELLLEEQLKLPAKEPTGRKVMNNTRKPPVKKPEPDDDDDLELAGEFSED
jgi:hypothetical protein